MSVIAPALQDAIKRELLLIRDASDLARRLDAFRFTYQKFDRIMSGEPNVKVVLITNPPGELQEVPAWTDGETIWINALMMQAQLGREAFEKVVMATKSLNLHELCHVLYTPRADSEMWRWIKSETDMDANGWSRHVKRAFNILEDQRIETLFAAQFRPAIPYFEGNVLTWMLERKPDEIGTFFPIIYGRRFLPRDMVHSVEEAFIGMVGWEDTKEFKRIIDRYLKLVFPNDTEEAKRLVIRFAKLMDKINPKLPCGMEPLSGGHGVPGKEGEPKLIKGKPNVKLQEEGQKKAKGMKPRQPQAPKSGSEPQKGAGDEPGPDADGKGADGSEGDTEANAGKGDGNEKGDKPGDDDDDDYGHEAGTGAGKMQAPDLHAELEQQLADLMHDANFRAELDRTVNAIAEAMGEADLGVDGDRLQGTDQSVPSKAMNAMVGMREALRTLRVGLEETHHIKQLAGRIDGRRFMTRRPWDVDFFRQWEPGAVEETSIEAVIAVDQSSSMRHAQVNTALALWTAKAALEALDARVTVLGFADKGYVLYGPDEKVKQGKLRVFFPTGGTVPETTMAQAHRVLHGSKRKIKLLLTVTDGAWGGDVLKCDRYVQSMNADGVVTALCYIGTYADHRYRHEHTIFKLVNEPGELVPLALAIVENAMVDVINNHSYDD